MLHVVTPGNGTNFHVTLFRRDKLYFGRDEPLCHVKK